MKTNEELILQGHHFVSCMVHIGKAEGAESRTDYIVIYQRTKSLIIIKRDTAVSIYDFRVFMLGDYSTPLNAKRFKTREEAYNKMMRWIGKMVKNDTSYRYYNNKVDHLYEPVFSKDILDELRYVLI